MDAQRFACTWSTNLGWMAAVADRSELLQLTFGHASRSQARRMSGPLVDARLDWDAAPPPRPPAWLTRLIRRLTEFADGRPDDFQDVPLSLDHLSEFQRRVVDACRQIPFGVVLSYGQLAARAGSPKAARAAGSVMSGNRFPLIVPCHRVVGVNGLGGYSAPEGLDMKRRLLELENAALELQP